MGLFSKKLDERQEEVVKKARKSAEEVLDFGFKQTLKSFEWREDESVRGASDRLLKDLIAKLKELA